MATYGHAQLNALGDPSRRAILERLMAGPLPVGQLSARFSISRPAVSQHLRVLKAAHLVVDRREGTRRVYAIDPEGLDNLRRYFDRFWGTALTNFKKHAERHTK